MARRPKGVQSYVNEAQVEAVIKENPGILYAVNISWSAGTIGDEVILRDGTGNTDRIIFRFRAPTAAGSFAAALPEVGKEFLTGLYLDLQTTGGSVFRVCVDYD